MSDFTSVFPETSGLNPDKRVNYIHGLVLGVDEFLQNEFYLLEKDRFHNRSLHGYGTVCGLKVSVEDTVAGPEIKVEPGNAIAPNGQVIKVPRPQCALLAEWLASQSDAVAEAIGSPSSGPLSLYLMLCYTECKTDLVPISIGPCHSLEESTAPSRIADDFSLSFDLEPPPNYQFESPIDSLTELLLNIPVEAGGALTLEEIKELVLTLVPDTSSPPSSPPVSPPAITPLAPENVSEFFNAALLVWVTEVKPLLIPDSANVLPGDNSDNCVLLAQLNFDVVITESIAQLAGPVEIDESERQYLLSTQNIQNYVGPLSTLAKTQSDLALAEQDRVFKTIRLPAYQAHNERNAALGLFSDTLPSMHFITNGGSAFADEVVFSIPIPDDIEFESGLQFRLIWGFQGNPDPSAIKFNWRIGARYYRLNDSIPALPMEFVNVTVSEASARRNDVLVTPYSDFDNNIELTESHSYGAMMIAIEDPGVSISQVYLLEVELRYVANRLGGGIS